MTCDEFRRTCEVADPNQMTRAERAVHHRHFNECPACREWLRAGYERELKEMDPADVLTVRREQRALKLADLEDPEFVEVAGQRKD